MEASPGLGGEGFGGGDGAADGGEVGRFQGRVGEHHVVEGGDGEEDRRALGGDLLEGSGGGGAAAHVDRGRAGPEREREAVAEAVGVEELGGGEVDVVARRLEDVLRVVLAGVEDVGVAVDDALRPAGRSGAVEPERHVLGVGVDGVDLVVAFCEPGDIRDDAPDVGAIVEDRVQLLTECRVEDAGGRVAVVQEVGGVFGADEEVRRDRPPRRCASRRGTPPGNSACHRGPGARAPRDECRGP